MEKKYYHWLEICIDRLVPIAVLVLLGIIILEFFFAERADSYYVYIKIADYTVLGIFILDLIFKYLRIRNIPNFLKTCWLDIIAVFPFFLLFRVFESFLIFTELPKEVRQFQLVFHEGVELSKESSRIIQEAEEAGKISRVKTIVRMFEGLQESPKMVKALSFYEQPVGTHHLHEVKGKKEYKKIKKEVEEDIETVEEDIGKIEKDLKKIPEEIKKMKKKKK